MSELAFKDLSPLKGNALEISKYIDKHLAPNKRNPRNIVELARNPKSLIHKYFTWDDSVAAEKFRRLQASNLINVIIEVQTNEKRYLNVKVVDVVGRTYMTSDEVKAQPYLCRQMLDKCLGSLLHIESQYKNFAGAEAAFGRVFAEIRILKKEGIKYEEIKDRGTRKNTNQRSESSENNSQTSRNKADISKQPNGISRGIGAKQGKKIPGIRTSKAV